MRAKEKVPLRSFAKKSSNTFYITGLFMYGAKWDQERDTICDLSPNDKTGNEVPPIELTITEYNPLGGP